MFIPIIAIIIIIVIFLVDNKNNNINNLNEIFENTNDHLENKHNDICQLPSYENPMMNLTMNDIINNPNRPRACNLNDEMIKQQLNKFFDMNNNSILDNRQFFIQHHQQRYPMIKHHLRNGYIGYRKLVKKIKKIV